MLWGILFHVAETVLDGPSHQAHSSTAQLRTAFSVPSVQLSPLVLFFGVFLGPHLQYMEFPRLGLVSELQLLAYTTATAM